VIADKPLFSITIMTATNKGNEMEKQSNGVQSLEVGLSVLNVLVEAGAALMLKEVAAAADMHPAKAHRYLVSLVKCGYAKQQTDGRYRLGQCRFGHGLGRHAPQ
jgi:hypothetical protein